MRRSLHPNVGDRLVRRVPAGVGRPGLSEPAQPKLAGVAVAARGAVLVRVVAARRRRVVDAEPLAELNDLTFREIDERRANRDRRRTLDARTCAEVRHVLIGADVLRPAVRVPAVVQGVDADEDVACLEDFCPCQRERQEDRIASGDVGDRHLVVAGTVLESVLGHGRIARERRAAEHAKVDVRDDVLTRPVAFSDASRSVDFVRVTLPVAERQRVDRVALRGCQGEQGGGVEPATEKEYRRAICHATKEEEGQDVGEASRRTLGVVRIPGLVFVESSALRAEGINMTRAGFCIALAVVVAGTASCARKTIAPPAAPTPAAPAITDGNSLVSAMRGKYGGQWFKTVALSQNNTLYNARGGETKSEWREQISVPGKLRIDYVPLTQRSGVLFDGSRIHTFDNGRAIDVQPGVHPLLLLMADVYVLPVERSVHLLDSLGFDLSRLRRDTWEGQGVYV